MDPYNVQLIVGQYTSVLIPYISFALIIYGIYFIFGAGLYIQKKSKQLFHIILVSAIFNVICNIILIPIYGIRGAAISTLLSYIAFTGVIIKYSNRIIRIKIDVVYLLKYLFASLIMISIISLPGISALNLILRIAIGFVIYFVAILFFDKNLRQIFWRIFGV